MGEIRNVLLDLDGVLYERDEAIGGAAEALAFLEERRIPFLLVTNVTRMPVSGIVKKLAGFGLRVPPERILSALSATVDYCSSKKPGATCFLIAPDSAGAEFEAAGLRVTRNEEPADFVVVGYDTRTDFGMLDSAFRLLERGAELIAMHEDKRLPGKPSIGLGAFVKALEYSTGKRAAIIGKPSTTFFRLALEKIGGKAGETAMVGDSLSSDILGAKNAGMRTVLVKTGNFNEAELRASKTKPDFIIDSILGLPGLLQA